MTPLTTVLLAALLVLGGLWAAWKRDVRLGLFSLILLLFIPQWLGYWQLDQWRGRQYLGFILSFFGALCAGYGLASRLPQVLVIKPNLPGNSPWVNLGLLVVVLGISAYHTVALGIPILRSDVEVARFSFSESGFFGIPSRFFLIVLPALVIYLTQQYLGERDRWSWWLLLVAWAGFTTLQLASGFKGAVLTALVIGLFAYTAAAGSVRVRDLLRGRVLAALGVAVIAAVVLSFAYTSRGVGSVAQSLSYLSQRLTVTAVEAGYLVLQRREQQAKPTTFLLDDTRYFLDRYFHLGTNPGGQYQPADKIISSALTNTPLDGQHFVVSVTTGLAPLLRSDYGGVVALLGAALLGGWLAWLLRYSREFFAARHYVASALATYLVYNTYVVLANGNPIYWLINTLAGLLMLGGLYLGLTWLMSALRRSAR